MDDVAALQRTVRRCTALLLIALAIVIGTIDDGQFWVAAVVAVGSLLYLLASFVFVSERAVGSASEAADG